MLNKKLEPNSVFSRLSVENPADSQAAPPL